MTSRIRPWAAAVLAATLLVGCSDGGGDESSAAAPAAGATTTSAPPETTTTTTVPPPPSTTVTTAAPAPAPPTTKPAPPTTKAPKPAAPSPTTAPPPLDLTGFTVVQAASSDPAEFARQVDDLVAAQAAILDRATPAGDLDALALRQQNGIRALAARPAALPAALERAPVAMRPILEANVNAGAELRTLAGEPRKSLPAWRIIPAPPAPELEGYYREAEARFGVPWAYLAAVHLVESRMGRIRGTSTAGAEGPMQFLPRTWQAYGMGGDINNARDAIFGAANYLRANKTGAGDGMANALFNYNHSQRYVRAVTAYAKQIEADHRAYEAYYHWQVFYITVAGDVLLQEGYAR